MCIISFYKINVIVECAKNPILFPTFFPFAATFVKVGNEVARGTSLNFAAITGIDGTCDAFLPVVNTCGVAISIDVSKQYGFKLFQLFWSDDGGFRHHPPRDIFAGWFCNASVVSVEKHGGHQFICVRIKLSPREKLLSRLGGFFEIG